MNSNTSEGGITIHETKDNQLLIGCEHNRGDITRTTILVAPQLKLSIFLYTSYT